MITQEYLKECLHYNKETGVFTWKERPSRHFSSERRANATNLKFAGKMAGTIVDLGPKGYVKKYVRIGMLGRKYLAHRLAWLYETGEFPADETDHVNGEGTDNRFDNLRPVSKHENRKNLRIYSGNKSGCCGVWFDKNKRKWRVRIGSGINLVYIGYFDTIFGAVCARKSAEKQYGYHENHGRVSTV